MIKALLLIFASSRTWERIARTRRSFLFVLFLYLLPTIALSIAGEISGRNYLASRTPELSHQVLAPDFIVRYASAELAAGLAVVFICAQVIKQIAATFHNRNTYAQCFIITAYASGPFYLFHLLDAIPQITPWVGFAAGSLFTFGALYSAVPQVLKPDPPHAFGVFLMGGISLTMLNLLARLFTLQVLQHKINLF